MLIRVKKAELYALLKDKEEVLAALQHCGEFMAEDEEGGSKNTADAGADAQRTLDSLKFISAYAKKAPLLQERTSVDYAELLKDDPRQQALADEAAKIQSELSAQYAQSVSLRMQAEQLAAWEGLDVPFEQIKPTQSADFLMGYAPPSSAEEAARAVEDAGAVVTLYGSAQEGKALFAAFHKSVSQEVAAAAADAGVQLISPPRYIGTAAQAKAELLKSAAEADSTAAAIAERAKAIAESKRELELVYEKQAAKYERENTPSQATMQTFRLVGYVRKDRTEKVEKAISAVTDAYSLEFTEPDENDRVPTVIENKKIVTPFEFITNLYATPAAGSIDPNPLMAPFFFIFFGMMVSDAVYGLLIAAATFAYLKLLKPKGGAAKLITVLCMGGVSTFIWGAMFGGWLGFEAKPILFVPMTSPIPMLILCFSLGLIQLIAGTAIKAYMCFRDGDWQGAVYDNISWILICVGAVLLIVNTTLGAVIACAGALIIVAFGGRDKQGIVSRIVGGLGTLYGVTGYFSDVLSYSRLFALGLATGVIGMVINTLAEMTSASGPLGMFFAALIMIGGHAFNIAVNTLGAYVHASRLQYIEYYGKFFEAGGRQFTPLAVNPRYIDVR